MDGGIVQLSDTTPASMSFFGFTPAFFEVLATEFETFLSTNIDEPKFEFYITHAIDQAVRERGATVQVIRTDADWFGVTNPADKEICQQSIQKLVQTGTYPDPLWS